MRPTLGQLLQKAERDDANRAAIRVGGRVLSYGELDDRANLLAGSLAEMGHEGSRTGLLLPNGAAFPVGLHALFRIGSSALLLNPANAPRELAEQLADAGTETVLTTNRLHGSLPASIRAILLDELTARLRIGDGDGSGPLGTARPPAGSRHPGADDEAVVIFTSAMEGRSRGAPLTHANLVANTRSVVEALRMSGDDRVLGALPFAHAFGLTVCLNAALAVGATVLPLPRFNPLTILELLLEEQATIVAGVPAIFLGLLAAAEKRGVADHSLRIAVCGGAPMPLDLCHRWEDRFGIPLRQGYGLTEASPVCLFNRIDEPNRPGTLGQPLPGVDVSIRDGAGAALANGEVGEICVRGENVFGGYLDGSRTMSYFHGPWLRTGDLGSSDGHTFRFRGTVKPMFTRNGFNVYPAEVRRALRDDSRIADVVVYGRPDPQRENEIVLEVRPVPGITLTEEDVRGICVERLASYKQPARIVLTA
jgi:long-chain acyl-CoA synthetase